MVEKILFTFKSPPKEFEVRKIKTDRVNEAYGSWFGKVRWRVEKVQVAGISVKVGDVLTTAKVYQIARTIDQKAAHQFELYNPKQKYDTQEEG